MTTFKFSLVTLLFLMFLPLSYAHANSFFGNYASYYSADSQTVSTESKNLNVNDYFSSNSKSKNAALNKELSGFPIHAAPEPVSTTLFLTGALIMGIGILRRKKALTV